MKPGILIIEDDPEMARVLQQGLEQEDYSVTLANNGWKGLHLAQAGLFSVILLDVMLPSLDGCSLARQLRAGGNCTPILMLTAMDGVGDIVNGFDAGAQDYLTKPFSFLELLARLRSLTRRGQPEVTSWCVSDLTLDDASRQVFRGSNPILLTRTEYLLLRVLLRNAGHVVSRGEIVRSVWGAPNTIEPNGVDVHMKALRAKVDQYPEKLIETVRGFGYRLRSGVGSIMRVPIRVRLTAVYCIVFCVSTLLLEMGTYWGISAAIYAIVDHDLQSRLTGVGEFLTDHVARRPLPQLQDELRRHEALQPAYLSIAETGGRQLFQGSALHGLDASHSTSVWTVQGSPASIRILASHRTIHGRQYDLFLGTSLTVPFGIMRKAGLLLWLSAPLVLLCASLAGYWISGRALAPVSELTRTARSIGAGDLTQRVCVPPTADELQDLAVTLNEMLARIDTTFRQVAQFTANASHELRTPLALIRTTSEVALLCTSGNTASYREALHRILSEAERNTVLLDNLLVLARADSGRHVMDRCPVDIGKAVLQTCEQVQLLAAEKNLHLRVELEDDSPWVSANSDYLRRLWLILLDNAVKYSASGEIVVAVKTSNPGFVSVDVIDSGIGIAEKDLPRIFERFFRADETRTRGVGGSGLGLSIARWIADSHHATISARSTMGKGSVFRVVFPRIAASL